MNRHLYKAKLKETDKWVIGYHVMNIPDYEDSDIDHYIITPDNDTVIINESTLCQCTGKLDINDKPIFEHDYLQLQKSNDIVEVVWKQDECGFVYRFFDEGQEKWIYPDERDDMKVAGNFFDNPEMYKALFGVLSGNIIDEICTGHLLYKHSKLDNEENSKERSVITMENYRDFGLYTKEDVLKLIREALSRA